MHENRFFEEVVLIPTCVTSCKSTFRVCGRKSGERALLLLLLLLLRRLDVLTEGAVRARTIFSRKNLLRKERP